MDGVNICGTTFDIGKKGEFYMSRYVNRGIRQFSQREKRAFSAGRGYGAAKRGKRVKCVSADERRSFLNGMNTVK
jgi:hypothetical protein